MSKWHYVEKDGNPKAKGFYIVACETYVTFADDSYDEEENRIEAYGEPYRGLCFWDGAKWMESENNSFNIDDCCSAGLRKNDHIYAWADAIPETPKMIYPSRTIEIDPSEYHLTEKQMMDFLNDYKRSFEEGYTK